MCLFVRVSVFVATSDWDKETGLIARHSLRHEQVRLLFTDEQVRLLSQRMHSAQQKLEEIHRKTETDLWMEDLSALRNKYLELFGR